MSETQADSVIAEITANPYSDPAIYEASTQFSDFIAMPKKGIPICITLAEAERKKGNIEEAKKVFGVILLMAPENIQAMIGLAECLIDDEEPEQAFLLSAAIIASDYSHVDGHMLSARSNTMMERYEQAEADLKIVIDLAKQNNDGRLELLAEKMIRANRNAAEVALAAEAAEEESAGDADSKD